MWEKRNVLNIIVIFTLSFTFALNLKISVVKIIIIFVNFYIFIYFIYLLSKI